MKTNLKKLVLGASILSLVTGCAQPRNTSVPNYELNTDRFALAPKPSNPDTELAQLIRYKGQTKFASLQYSYDQGAPEQQQKQEESQDEAGGQPRPEQESDVYKVGKPGSKLLYLLNNYRGLQVISYADGIDKPKILGRVRATGNYPDEMYYDQARDRIIVLERIYRNQDGSWRNNSASRLLIYNVSDATSPRIDNAVEIEGEIADSRIVGDVLYVASANYDGEKRSGAIYSYSLKGSDLRLVDQRALQLPVSSAQNMNIITVAKDAGYRYYLIASLSQTGWGWFDRQSLVEVIDISDPKGDIVSVMSVAAKGFVRERSQTLIKNDTLIVTSNYFITPENQQQQIARIAVETFKFPTAATEYIDENEATYRKLHIDRALKGKTGMEYEKILEQMMNDPELGLKGRFVRTADEVRKIMPDSSVTVGDGSGLSANLQDVRYDGDHLYAFWVPANEVDPFDLFDISKPEEGVKYLSRLHFDGWISRAIPMTVQGRKFVLGLGWIVPVVDNENNRRQPQAMIFEIVEMGGKLRAIDVAQYTFEGSNIWTDFNTQDKMVEVKLSGEGKGQILFGAYKWSEDGLSASGGQLLSFDIGQVIANKHKQALTKGAFVSTGNDDWVRRVFTNSEIERLNTFSDEALGTYGEASQDGTISAINILELARNIRAYVNIAGSGVQVVSDYAWSANPETRLRQVDARRADSELSDAKVNLEVKGSYVSHLVDEGAIYLLTNKYDSVVSENGDYHYFATAWLTKFVVSNGALSLAAQTTWTAERRTEMNPISLREARGFARYYETSGLIRLANGEILAQVDSTIKRVSNKSALAVSDLILENCKMNDPDVKVINVVSGKLILNTVEVFDSKEYKDLLLSYPYISQVTLENGKGTCGAKINLPGDVKMFTESGEVLVDETWVTDIEQKKKKTDDGEVYYETHTETENSLLSFKIDGEKAKLVDEVKNASASQTDVHALSDREVVHLVHTDQWSSRPKLEFLSLDEEANIAVGVSTYSSDMNAGTSLITLVPHPKKPGSFLGLTQNSMQMQAIEFSLENRRPVVVPVQLINEKFEAEKAEDIIATAQTYYYGERTPANFNKELMSFEISTGLTGITQLLVSQ